jgi:phage terminase small subunit
LAKERLASANTKIYTDIVFSESLILAKPRNEMKTPPKLPPPPKHLSRTAKAYWNKIVTDYDMSDSDLLILESIASALDREAQARAGLAAAGSLVVKDRFGVEKAHPLIAVESRARAAVLAGIRALNFEDSEPKPDGRHSRTVF